MKYLRSMLVGGFLAFALILFPSAGAEAVTISPPYYETTLNPGDTEFGGIKLHNEDSDNPITLYPIVQNFTYGDNDESGTPDFYPASEDPAGTALAKWISIDPEPITIGPGERASVQYAINVPSDKVQPGGHYGAIIFATEPPETQGGAVGIGQQIASLLFVRITGDVKEIGSIAEFGFEDPKVWYNYLPVDFFLRFENSGNVHLRPTGNLFIKNWYGRQVASIKVNEGFSSVLPLSIRRYQFGWQKGANAEGLSELAKEWRNFAFGKYTAQLVLTYGSDNQVIVDEREFTVWPWRLMIVFLVGGLVALVALWAGMRAYNKSVIKKYQRSIKK